MTKYVQRQVGFCNTCAWYVRFSSENIIEGSKERGECHQSPPVMIYEHGRLDQRGKWSIVERWDFCGSYTYRDTIYMGDDPISSMRK